MLRELRKQGHRVLIFSQVSSQQGADQSLYVEGFWKFTAFIQHLEATYIYVYLEATSMYVHMMIVYTLKLKFCFLSPFSFFLFSFLYSGCYHYYRDGVVLIYVDILFVLDDVIV